jgi:hypothetical protein
MTRPVAAPPSLAERSAARMPARQTAGAMVAVGAEARRAVGEVGVAGGREAGGGGEKALALLLVLIGGHAAACCSDLKALGSQTLFFI